MKQSNAIILAAFLLTTLAVYLLGFFPFIPPWAVFIAWACFFHLDGGINRNQAYITNIQHIGLGAALAWGSALLLISNPFSSEPMSVFWGPVMIGIVIAIIAKLSTTTRFCVMPAVIYGYASVFAYLNAPGLFSTDKLLSMSFQNALVAIGVSIIFGTCAGYLNAMLVSQFVGIRFKLKTRRVQNFV